MGSNPTFPTNNFNLFYSLQMKSNTFYKVSPKQFSCVSEQDCCIGYCINATENLAKIMWVKDCTKHPTSEYGSAYLVHDWDFNDYAKIEL